MENKLTELESKFINEIKTEIKDRLICLSDFDLIYNLEIATQYRYLGRNIVDSNIISYIDIEIYKKDKSPLNYNDDLSVILIEIQDYLKFNYCYLSSIKVNYALGRLGQDYWYNLSNKKNVKLKNILIRFQ